MIEKRVRPGHQAVAGPNISQEQRETFDADAHNRRLHLFTDDLVQFDIVSENG
jgi:hypothetical protein